MNRKRVWMVNNRQITILWFYPHEVIRTRLQTQQSLEFTTISSGKMFGNGQKLPLDPSYISRAKDYDSVAKKSIHRYRGVIGTVKTIWLEEGWQAFYAGMGTSMIRAVPT